MTLLAAMLAITLLAGGAACLYVATPNQRLLARSPAPRFLRIVGLVCLVCALAVLLGLMGPATAVFTWMTGLMLAWTIPPVVVGWLRYRKREES